MNNYTYDHIDNVLTVRFQIDKVGWKQEFLLSSDRHHDNKFCNRVLETQHLKAAADKEAYIIDAGDLFCAMQGKYDPRSDMTDIRPEDVGIDYLDRIRNHAYEDYQPYLQNWMLIGRGNHDQNILKRHHTDLIDGLVTRMRTNGSNVVAGGYGGWIRFMFTYRKTVSKSVLLKYHHGGGGGFSPVTKGTIQTNRQAVYLPDADIVQNGHNHEGWVMPLARERLSVMSGKISRDYIWFIRTPGYKDEYFGRNVGTGFEVEKMMHPKPNGAIWLTFEYDGDGVRYWFRQDFG